MTDQPKKTAIRIEGGSNIRVENNVALGYDEMLSATNTKNLTAKGNVAAAPPHTPSHRKRWHESGWFIWVSGIAGSLLVAYLVYLFGWQ